jgi:hypothetical protein
MLGIFFLEIGKGIDGIRWAGKPELYIRCLEPVIVFHGKVNKV